MNPAEPSSPNPTKSRRLQNFHNIDLTPRLEMAIPANPSI